MSRLERQAYLDLIGQLIPGEDEDSLKNLTDLRDTYLEPEKQTNVDYKEKYENLQKQYRDAILNGAPEPPTPPEPPEPPTPPEPPKKRTEKEIIDSFFIKDNKE